MKLNKCRGNWPKTGACLCLYMDLDGQVYQPDWMGDDDFRDLLWFAHETAEEEKRREAERQEREREREEARMWKRRVAWRHLR